MPETWYSLQFSPNHVPVSEVLLDITRVCDISHICDISHTRVISSKTSETGTWFGLNWSEYHVSGMSVGGQPLARQGSVVTRNES